MRGVELAVALLLAVMSTTALAASDDCQRLLAKGLVEFHAGRYDAALPLLDQAVAADTTNADALYYRGLTHGRLEQHTEEIADLRTVLALAPDHSHAPFDLGVALVLHGDNAEAVAPLEQAQKIPELKAQASLFLGMAQLRLGQFEAARSNFEAANAGDTSLALPARYYTGVAAYQQHDWKQAETEFGYVSSVSPGSEMGKEATIFLERMRQGTGPTRRRRLLYADLGFQYDSNVVLAPSDDGAKQNLDISNQGDGRAVITVGVLFAPWRNDTSELTLGYELFQSLHFDLTDFNLQDHRPTVQFSTQIEALRFGLLGQYDFYLLDRESFLQEATALPWLQYLEGDFGRTELDYRMRYRDYRSLPYDGLRDAFNHAATFRQFFYLGAPQRYLWAGYRFDQEDTTHHVGDQFGYDGHQGSAGVGWPLPYGISSDLSYAYRNENYGDGSHGRRDQEHRGVVAVQKSLTEHLLISLAYLGSFNGSTESDFEYDRHIVSLTLGARF